MSEILTCGGCQFFAQGDPTGFDEAMKVVRGACCANPPTVTFGVVEKRNDFGGRTAISHGLDSKSVRPSVCAHHPACRFHKPKSAPQSPAKE